MSSKWVIPSSSSSSSTTSSSGSRSSSSRSSRSSQSSMTGGSHDPGERSSEADSEHHHPLQGSFHNKSKSKVAGKSSTHSRRHRSEGCSSSGPTTRRKSAPPQSNASIAAARASGAPSKAVQNFLDPTETDDDGDANDRSVLCRERTLQPGSLRSSRHASPQPHHHHVGGTELHNAQLRASVSATVAAGASSSSRRAASPQAASVMHRIQPDPNDRGAVVPSVATAAVLEELSSKRSIQMEFGDEYVGETAVVTHPPPAAGGSSKTDAKKSSHKTTPTTAEPALPAASTSSGHHQHHGSDHISSDPSVAINASKLYVPNGSGTLQSSSGKHCYVGDFVMRERHGLGKLLTESAALWCRWANNRPEFSVSARLDHTTGDKYFGYLAARTDNEAFQRLSKQQANTMSRFSMWVNSTVFVKERWGELVSSDGSRYFGQWEADRRNGFGCWLHADGERYVGMLVNDTYDGPGVLFSPHRAQAHSAASPSSSSQGAATSAGGGAGTSSRGEHGGPCLSDGAGGPRMRPNEPPAEERCSHIHANAVMLDLQFPPSETAASCPTVMDGVWHRGVLAGDEAQATFPCGSQIVGEWAESTHKLRGGRVVCPRKPRSFTVPWSPDRPTTIGAPRWVETYQWEPLLSASSEATKHRAVRAARAFRSRIAKCATRDAMALHLRRLLKEDTVVANSIKIFRRCFYFFYGTCGASNELGGGLAGNLLGWCQFRAAYGGCIHRGRGKPVEAQDIDHALGDMFSMVASIRRWVAELLGEEGMQRVHEFDAETVISRGAMDAIMAEVHPLLVNLYASVYRSEEEAVQYAVYRLRHVSLDDLGVNFGRQESDRLFDPYADAARSLEELPRCRTLTEHVQALLGWSREIDTSTKLAQMQLHEEQLVRLTSAMRERRQSVAAAAAAAASPSTAEGVAEGSASSRLTQHPPLAATPPPLTGSKEVLHVVSPSSAHTTQDGAHHVGYHDIECGNNAENASFAGSITTKTTATDDAEDDGVSLLPLRSDSPSSMQWNHSFATPAPSPVHSRSPAAREVALTTTTSTAGSPDGPRSSSSVKRTDETQHDGVGDKTVSTASVTSRSSPAGASTAAAGGGSSSSMHLSEAAAATAKHRRQRAHSKFLTEAASSMVQAGSADDLLPIHQYVLLRGGSRVPNLYSITMLLVDLSADEMVVDGTSQDSFCITTLHACVTTLPHLNVFVREESSPSASSPAVTLSTVSSSSFWAATGVMVPMTVFERRIEDVVSTSPELFRRPTCELLLRWLPSAMERLAFFTPASPTQGGGGAKNSVTVGKIKRWDSAKQHGGGSEGTIVRIEDLLSECPSAREISRCGGDSNSSSTDSAHFRAADKLLGAIGLRLHGAHTDAASSEDRSVSGGDAPQSQSSSNCSSRGGSGNGAFSWGISGALRNATPHLLLPLSIKVMEVLSSA